LSTELSSESRPGPELIHSKQIYQRIGSLNVKTVRYSSSLSTLMTVLVIATA
jgi:hypothetical protein